MPTSTVTYIHRYSLGDRLVIKANKAEGPYTVTNIEPTFHDNGIEAKYTLLADDRGNATPIYRHEGDILAHWVPYVPEVRLDHRISFYDDGSLALIDDSGNRRTKSVVVISGTPTNPTLRLVWSN